MPGPEPGGVKRLRPGRRVGSIRTKVWPYHALRGRYGFGALGGVIDVQADKAWRPGARREDVAGSRFERNERFERGLVLRESVLGREHVERSLARAEEDPFLLPIQQLAVEFGWGEVWSRPGLPRKTRSFLSIAYLAAQGKLDELGAHVAGAVRNGASREEIGEVLLQAALYCGMPAGLEAFRVAKRALDDLEAGGREGTQSPTGEDAP